MRKQKNWNQNWMLLCLCVLLLCTSEAWADFTVSDPIPVGLPVNRTCQAFGRNYSSPEITPDGLSFYFSSERLDGLGGQDLYVTTRESLDAPWSEAVNLGVTVNSGKDERSPVLTADELELYFSCGAWDQGQIYVCRRASRDDPWGQAALLGPQINSTGGASGPSLSPDGLSLYFRDGKRAGGTKDYFWVSRRPSPKADWSAPKRVKIDLGGINRQFLDTPRVSSDELSLYFSVGVWNVGFTGVDFDLYVATRPTRESPWGRATDLGPNVNSPHIQEYDPALAPDQMTLYFTRHSKIYKSVRQSTDEPFGLAVPLGGGTDWDARLSADGLALYFASDRAGSVGDFDIWVALRESYESPWQEPVNLGPNINTVNSEREPCVSADGLELYFASMVASGNSDLFVSRRATRDDPWGPDVRLGYGINSHGLEISPVLSRDGQTLYFSSNMRTGGNGWLDFYKTQKSVTTNASGESVVSWSEPVNLGRSNSGRFEYSLTASKDGQWLSFLRDVKSTNDEHLMLSRRRPDGQWGSPRNLTREFNLNMNQPNLMVDPKLSADGRAILMTRRDANALESGDIWQMDVRPVVDLNRDGWVSEMDRVALDHHLGQDLSWYDIAPPFGDGIIDEQDLAELEQWMGQEQNDPSLQAYWKLDETEGTIAWDSVGDRHGTLSNEPTWQLDSGLFGGALQFDGTNDHLTLPHVLDLSEGPFTLMLWIKGGMPGQVVLSQADGADLLMIDAATGVLATEVLAFDQWLPFLSESVVTDNHWHHLRLIWDGADRILYVDDVEVFQGTLKFQPSQLGLTIGAGKDLAEGSFWSGMIDDVRIYNQVIVPQEWRDSVKLGR